MNNEQMTQEQRAQLIEKLRTEYKDLNGKIARLNAFLCDINFVKKVPDPTEQSLMSMQLRSMKGYLDNLRARIMFQEIKQSQEEKNSQAIDDLVNMNRRVVNTLCGPVHLVNLDEQHHCGQDECNRSGLMTLKEMVNDYVERCDENGRLKIDLHHCGQDAVNEEQLTDGMAERLTNGYKNYCRAALEAYLERKITWWQLKEKMLMPDLVEWVKACGQDATCPVGGGNAAVITGDSLKDLLGMEVISVGDMPCDACNPDNYAGRLCVKVELVGGTYLCLAPQPNSIITE